MSQKDTLFRQQIMEPGDFVFDERVVRVFPDMINRSVPGYGLIVPMIGMLARRYVQAGTTIYDLGCSLGAVSLAIRQAVPDEGVKLIAVDNSPQMVARFQQLLSEQPDVPPIEIAKGDIRDVVIRDASVVVLIRLIIEKLDFLPVPKCVRNGLNFGEIFPFAEIGNALNELVHMLISP